MRICFVVGEFFAYGRYGGFGSLSRTLAKHMAGQGHDVFAVVPRHKGFKPRETMDGVEVLSYPVTNWSTSIECFRECDCDVYHSEEPTTATHYAQKAMPDRTHIVTAQDPRDKRDWWIEFKYHTLRKKITFPVSMAFEYNPIVRRAVRSATRCYTQAKFVAGKVKKMYGLDYLPKFLPNPVEVPRQIFDKPATPVVTFLARLDGRKRPELFFELAREFPDIEFVTLGAAKDAKRDAMLRERYGGIPNLKFEGFIDQFGEASLTDYLARTCIMCNTAARECLPVSFLEASAHQCAILSYVNPDDFASERGYHAADEDFAKGLRWLLEGDRWREMGMKGYEYVKENHELKRVVDMHLAVYEEHVRKR